MTIVRAKSGLYEGDFRFKGFERLHLSLGVRWLVPAPALPAKKRDAERVLREHEADAEQRKAVAQARHDAVAKLFRQRRAEMIAQLRLPKGHPQRLTVERLEQMMEHNEPLVPVAPPPAPSAPEPAADESRAASPWGTVREVCDRYLAWLDTNPRKAGNTHKAARSQVRRFCAFVYRADDAPEGTTGVALGGLRFEDVTHAMVEAYQAHLVAVAKPNTVTAYMVRVGAVWNWAIDREQRLANEERRPPRPIYSPVDASVAHRTTTRRDRYLTAAEGRRVLAATPPNLYAVVCLGLLAGLRVEEALFLRRADVDLENGVLRIVAKDMPDGTRWKPKTKRGVRTIPVNPDLTAVLAAHVRSPYAGDYWLTPRPADPSWPWYHRVFDRHFTAVVERAKLVPGRDDPRGVTFHTLRHTFATHLASAGVDMKNLSELLGDSLTVTAEVYADLLPEAKQAAVAKLSGVFNVPALADLGSDETDTESDTGRAA